jgi:hypothetical protein
MAKKATLVWWFFAAACGAGGIQSCAYLTGIPVKTRIQNFWWNDVKPLMEHGWNVKNPPPDELKGWPERRDLPKRSNQADDAEHERSEPH